MQFKGKITSWNDEKGFGFVEPCNGGKKVFLHIKALTHRGQLPKIGQLVTYSLSSDKQGRPCAVKANLAGVRTPQKTKSSGSSLSIIVAAIFLIIVGLSALTAKIPTQILGLYSVVSLLTFFIYALDKSAAKKGAWRTQESTLHMLSLAGGWPGALVAQQKLRHKSKNSLFV